MAPSGDAAGEPSTRARAFVKVAESAPTRAVRRLTLGQERRRSAAVARGLLIRWNAMSQSFAGAPKAEDVERTAAHPSPTRRPPPYRPSVRMGALQRRAMTKARGKDQKRRGIEILVAVRNLVDGANLENVCLVVAGSAYATSGTGVVRPGNTSPPIELPPDSLEKNAAVYFELGMGAHRIALVTDPVFALTPGAVCVLTVSDQTRAHRPPIEVEGAVAHLMRSREATAT